MLLVRMLETVVKYIWKEKVIKVCLVLLVSARRMIQVMSGVTDPRVQQLQVKKTFKENEQNKKYLLTWGSQKWEEL